MPHMHMRGLVLQAATCLCMGQPGTSHRDNAYSQHLARLAHWAEAPRPPAAVVCPRYCNPIGVGVPSRARLSTLQGVLLQALECGCQPGNLHALHQGANSESGSRQAALDAFAELLGGAPCAAAALLGEGAALTPEQLHLLNDLLQQQDELRAAAQQDGGEEGDIFDDAEEGMDHDLQEEGMARECADTEAGGSGGTKQHFQQLLTSPLWRCQEETAQLQLYQAIFLLMAWKMDYVVRDAAFITLLGILCHFLLPKVCPAREVGGWAGRGRALPEGEPHAVGALAHCCCANNRPPHVCSQTCFVPAALRTCACVSSANVVCRRLTTCPHPCTCSSS